MRSRRRRSSSALIGTRFLTPFITAGTMGLTEAGLSERAAAYADWLTSDQPELGAFE